jgi:diguanylate cyclase (GGDEF)-like protein
MCRELVTDEPGSHVDDLLLQEVGRRLRRALRPADTVARLGGDEFAVLIEDTVGEDEARIVAWRLTEAVAQPMKLGAKPSCSSPPTARWGRASNFGLATESSEVFARSPRRPTVQDHARAKLARPEG